MFGSHLSRCHSCGTEFICGDCITFICPDCSKRRIPFLKVECPEHGMTEAESQLALLRLECGCVFFSTMEGWIKEQPHDPQP